MLTTVQPDAVIPLPGSQTQPATVTLKPSIRSLRRGWAVSPALLVIAVGVSLAWVTRGHPEAAIAELALAVLAVIALALTVAMSHVRMVGGKLLYRGVVGSRSVDAAEVVEVRWLRPLSAPTLTYCVIIDTESRCRIALVMPFWDATEVADLIAAASLPVASERARTVSARDARAQVRGMPLFLTHPVAVSMAWAVALLVLALIAIAAAAPR